MTDETQNGVSNDAANAARPAGGMPVQINAQYIKDLSFENPSILKNLSKQNQKAPAVNVNLSVTANSVGEDAYEVVLSVKVDGKQDDEAAFIIELAYAGIFTLSGFPKEHLMPFLYIECPRLLFPFARAIVADMSRDGGYPPLMLNPIDFAELFRRQQAAKAEQGEAQPEAANV